MNASALLLRAASRRGAGGMSSAAMTGAAVRSASVLAGGAGGTAGPGPTTFQGSGFKAVGLRSLSVWSAPLHSGGITGSSLTSSSPLNSRPAIYALQGSIRHLSFLSDYDAHVTERAALAGGLGVAPQPLTAAQVATLIEEIRGAKEGGAEADRVRCCCCVFVALSLQIDVLALNGCADIAMWSRFVSFRR